VVLGVIESSSIIVVSLAQLVQWLSLTHSLTSSDSLSKDEISFCSSNFSKMTI
jgi:hypothetical protein